MRNVDWPVAVLLVVGTSVLLGSGIALLAGSVGIAAGMFFGGLVALHVATK